MCSNCGPHVRFDVLFTLLHRRNRNAMTERLRKDSVVIKRQKSGRSQPANDVRSTKDEHFDGIQRQDAPHNGMDDLEEFQLEGFARKVRHVSHSLLKCESLSCFRVCETSVTTHTLSMNFVYFLA